MAVNLKYHLNPKPIKSKLISKALKAQFFFYIIVQTHELVCEPRARNESNYYYVHTVYSIYLVTNISKNAYELMDRHLFE